MRYAESTVLQEVVPGVRRRLTREGRKSRLRAQRPERSCEGVDKTQRADAVRCGERQRRNHSGDRRVETRCRYRNQQST